MAEAAGAIFGPINADTNDTYQFTSVVVEGSNTFAAASAAAAHGTYGFRFTGANSEGGRGIKTFTEVGDGYFRFYMRIPTSWDTVDTGVTYAKILMLLDGSTEIASIQIRVDPSNGNIKPYRFYYRTNDTTLNNLTMSNSAAEIDDGNWHYWEVRYLSNNGGGIAQVWFDGSSVGAATSLATSNYLPDSAEMGTQNADNATWETGSILDYDDFIGDTSAIGAYEESGAALTATSLTLGAPSLGAPALKQVHKFTATALITTAPTLGTPTLNQVQILTAQELTTGPPTLGTPELTENAQGEDALTAASMTAGTPTLGTPAIGQIHGLTATAVASGTPTLGTPLLGQVHSLTATSITGGAPSLGTPILTPISGTHFLTASAFFGGTPSLGTPTIGQIHGLTAALTATAPALGTPTLKQEHALAAGSLMAGTPTLGTPALSNFLTLTIEYFRGTSAIRRGYAATAALDKSYAATSAIDKSFTGTSAVD